jgi:hypothetical protein
MLPLALVLFAPSAVTAQSLRYKLERVFDEVLSLELGGSPGAHGSHFSPDNVASSEQTIQALTTMIGTNLSSFPLSSTGATIIYDLSTGVPVRKTGSLGPIFSEHGTTLGQGRVILGYNFTHMRLNKVRGLELSNMKLSFTHQDVAAPGMGDSANELDTIDLLLDMEMEASILAFYLTAGLFDRLDVGIALPLINVHLKADPVAAISSYTFTSNDSANHFYGGTNTNPELSTEPTPIDDHASGIGDVALRAKLNFFQRKGGDLAALLEVRLPTGDEENFLGSGGTSVKGVLVGSYAYGAFTPHVNLAYFIPGAEYASDQLHLFLGSSQQVGTRFTFVLDLLSRFQVGETAEELQVDDPVVIRRPHSDGEVVKVVPLTNVPQSSRDNTLDLSLGAKWAPKDFLIILGNVMMPLNDDGLRSSLVTTLGFEFNF